MKAKSRFALFLNTLRTLLMLPWRNAITHVMEYTMLYWNSRGASTGNDLILPYSPGATKLTTGVLVDREGYLPTHLAKRRNVYAWRRAHKIQDLTQVPGRLARDAIHIAMP